MFAAFTAGQGVKAFAQQIITTDAAVGRLAANVGMTTEALTAWQGVAERTGGSASGIAGTFKTITAQLQKFYQTGELENYDPLARAGVNLQKYTSQATTAEERMLLLSDAFSKLSAAERQSYGTQAGFDEQTINLLGVGREKLKGLLEDQKKNAAVTKEQAEAAARLQDSWTKLAQSSEQLGRMMLTDVEPNLQRVIGSLQGMAQWGQENIGISEKIAAGLSALSAIKFTGLLARITGIGSGLGLILSRLTGIGTFIVTLDGGALNEGEQEGLDKMTDAQKRAAVGNTKGSSPAPDIKNKSVAHPELAAKAMAYFQSQGWTKEQAAGITANLSAESGFDHQAVGDNGKAYGIGQWHPDRQANFKKWAGKDILNSSLDEQLAFVNHELRTSEKKAGDALKRAGAAADAGSIVSRQYERPGKEEAIKATEAARRAALADAISIGGGARMAVGSPAASNSKTDVNIGQLTVQTQATDANGIAKDIGASVERHAFAAQANQGLQ